MYGVGLIPNFGVLHLNPLFLSWVLIPKGLLKTRVFRHPRVWGLAENIGYTFRVQDPKP